MNRPYFAPAYMRMLYRFLRLAEADEHKLFETTDVTAAQLMQADSNIPFESQMQICSNSLSLSQPGLGLRMGRQLQLAAHGALGTAMQNAANLNQALETFTQFGSTRATFFSLEKTIANQNCQLLLRVPGVTDDLVPFFSESILSIIDQSLTFYTGSAEDDKSITLGYPEPSYAAQYETMFRAPITFGAKESLVCFPTQYLELSTHEADANAFNDSIHRCRLEVEQHSEAGGIVDTLEQFLKNNPGKLWRVEEIAIALNMSVRTLMRRLKEQNTTYQQIRDNVIQSQATQYLRTMTVAATAAALGFSDESSFRRTFKRWFGAPPAVYRDE